MRALSKKLGMYAVSFVSAFAILELTLRAFHLGGAASDDKFLYPYSKIPGTSVSDIKEGFAVRTTNSQGLLDREYASRHGNPTRILIYGDSFTEAFQVDVDRTYENILEDSLTANGIPTEIWNNGHSGMGIQDFYEYYWNHARHIPHDVVMLQLNPGTIRATTKLPSDQDLASAEAESRGSNLLSDMQRSFYSLRKQSVLINTLYMRGYMFKRFVTQPSNDKDAEERFAEGQTSTSPSKMKKNTGDLEKKLADALTQFRRVAREHSADVVVFVFPPTPDNAIYESVERASAAADVRYLDVRREYAHNTEALPRPAEGFLNSVLGKGHLNEWGHLALGNALFHAMRSSVQ